MKNTDKAKHIEQLKIMSIVVDGIKENDEVETEILNNVV